MTMPGQLTGFSADETKLVTNTVLTATIWELTANPVYRPVYDPQAAWDASGPYRVSFSPAGRLPLVLTTGTGGVRVWDPASGRFLASLPIGVTRNALFTPNGAALLTSGEAGIQRWPLEWNDALLTIGRPEMIHSRGTHHCYAALSDDGQNLLAVVDSEDRQRRTACVLRLTPDGRLSGDDPVTILESVPTVADVDISPDGRWACGGAWHGPRLDLWDLSTGERLPDQFPGLTDLRGVFSPDGRWLLVTTRTDIRLLSVGDWVEQWRRPTAVSRGTIGFTPDSRCAVLSTNRQTLEFASVATGETENTLAPVGAYYLLNCEFSPDQRFLAMTTGRWTFTLWDVAQTQSTLGHLGLSWNIVNPTGQKQPRPVPPRVAVQTE